jgi:PilZ domain
MGVPAEIEFAQRMTPRRSRRHRAATRAMLNEPRQPAEPIVIVDISTHGCGFESRWAFPAGARVWLRIPGLEQWLATVIWHDGGKGGLEFARPLHVGVALRFARDIAANEG